MAETPALFTVGGQFNYVVGPVLASAATIAPTSGIHHVSGTVTITTITAPWAGFTGSVTLIPDGAWALGTGGNIKTAYQAVANIPIILEFDGTSWFPSTFTTGGLNYFGVAVGAGVSWASTNAGIGTLNINALALQVPLQFTAIDIFVSDTYSATNAGSSIGITNSASFGIWTNNASTLSLLSSGSTTVAFTVTGSSSSNSFNGIKAFQIPLSATLPPGNYWYGFISSTASAGHAIAAGISNVQASYAGAQSLYKGQFGSSSAGPIGADFGVGQFSASSAALPSSIGFSEVRGSAIANTVQFPVRFKGFSV